MNTPQFIGRKHQEQSVSSLRPEETGGNDGLGPIDLSPIDKLRQLLQETENLRPLDYPWGH